VLLPYHPFSHPKEVCPGAKKQACVTSHPFTKEVACNHCIPVPCTLPPSDLCAAGIDIDTDIFVNCNWVDSRWQ
jgi:hypothetical protein